MSSEGAPGRERSVCASNEPWSCGDVGFSVGGGRFGGED